MITLDAQRIRTRVMLQRTRLQWVGLGVGGLIVLALLLIHQPLYPAPWFDEGLNISTAATLARDGVYALPDSAGPRLLDPAIQTGPTVLVPVAVALALFGEHLIVARLVIVAFAMLALVCYGLVARRLVGAAGALLALGLVLVGNREAFASFVPMGRQVLGEVPALAYYLLGLLIWWRTLYHPSRHRWIALIFAGLAWGIAMVTKSQVLLLLPVSLGIMALLDLWYYRQAGIWAFVVPGSVMVGCVLAWYAGQMAIVGVDQFSARTTVLREGFALHIVSLDPAHWRNAASVIWQTGWWLWGAPGLLWGIWQARQRTWVGFRHASLLMLVAVMFIWFAVLSIGWGRYAFYPLVLTPIWTAGMLVTWWRNVEGIWTMHVQRAVMLSMVVVFVIANGDVLARNLIEPQDTGYLAMQRYLQAAVPANAVIETWSWEFGLAVPQQMHHPSTAVANTVTDYLWRLRQTPPADVHTIAAEADYLLIGPFEQWTGIYNQVLEQDEPAKIVRYGQYTLYDLTQPR